MRPALALIAMLLQVPVTLPAQRVETGFLDRTVTVSGLVYRYQVYLPAEYATGAQRWPVILFLHGAGERGADGLLQTNVGLPAAIRATPARYPAIVVIPQVPTDSLWLGTSAQAAISALDATFAEFRGDTDRVYLTGLSMGGNGTWNLAYQYPTRWAAVAPICSFVTPFPRLPGSRAIIPADGGDAFAALAKRLARVPTWIFHGETDPVVPVSESRRAAEAFKAAGADVRYTEFLGGGHNVWDGVYGSPQFQDWLFAQRRRR
ncbi:MAG TPA: PHB depolymerase family esterase [Gemmatimonadaceae bacterium]|nr:PHB depolymerase family esterase [Gemmatimonadaceae bacterium]